MREDYSIDWIIDGHCDSISFYADGQRTLTDADPDAGQWNLSLARSARIGLQFLACYIESEYKPDRATERGLYLIQAARRFAREHVEETFLVQSREDVRRLPQPDKIGLLLSVEGGEVLNDGLDILEHIYQLGVRSLGLTWNQRNPLASGVDDPDAQRGLTPLGRQVVARMNALGMLIDVSHMNSVGFWEVLAISTKPIVASHSCAQALCSHRRNLNDEQVLALRDQGGVLGINFYPSFLCGDGNAVRQDVIRHMQHIADVAGVSVLGLGSDFDGIAAGPRGLEDAGCYPHVMEDLRLAGFSRQEIQQITHENFQRVLMEVLIK
ncbi:MAG: dipeptidase [Peptococcaceae bacterium]|jgi:membrane dipeptidase|nr:dipeptidase [Peptococcaceae bacterium]